MIDTHCHLTHAKFASDVDETISRAREAGVAACVAIGTGVEDAGRAQALARRYPGVVFATAGLDPFSSHEAADRFDDALHGLEALLGSGEFKAVGEIGLDYHYDLDPRPVQVERFERQLELAARLDLPVVIHVRDAHADMAAILRSHSRNRGVIHSFTGNPEEARCYLDCGWMLAFNGVLTFTRADDVRDAALRTPRDSILVETDSPYLAPAPMRGRRCEPAYLTRTLESLARLRGEDLSDLDSATTANAKRLFGLAE